MESRIIAPFVTAWRLRNDSKSAAALQPHAALLAEEFQ